MKKIFITTTALVLLFALSASAQSFQERKVNDVFVGVGMPSGDFGVVWGSGFNFGVNTGKPISFNMDVTLNAMMSVHESTFDYSGVGIDVPSNTLVLGSVVTGVKYYLNPDMPSTKFFVTGGVGLINLATTEGAESSYNLGVEFGGGVDFGGFNLNLKVLNVFAEGSTMTLMPLTLGWKF